jgi:hypothetical protein
MLYRSCYSCMRYVFFRGFFFHSFLFCRRPACIFYRGPNKSRTAIRARRVRKHEKREKEKNKTNTHTRSVLHAHQVLSSSSPAIAVATENRTLEPGEQRTPRRSACERREMMTYNF